MNVENFKSAFGSISKPSLFQVTLAFPAGIGSSSQDTFYCKAASVPTRSIGVIDLAYMGRKIKIPGDSTFEDWDVTIYNDMRFTIRRKLESWIELVNEARGNKGTTSFLIPKVNLRVDHMNQAQGIIKTYILVGAFPNSPGAAIDLNWETTDTAEEYGVTFAYDYWTSDTSK